MENMRDPPTNRSVEDACNRDDSPADAGYNRAASEELADYISDSEDANTTASGFALYEDPDEQEPSAPTINRRAPSQVRSPEADGDEQARRTAALQARLRSPFETPPPRSQRPRSPSTPWDPPRAAPPETEVADQGQYHREDASQASTVETIYDYPPPVDDQGQYQPEDASQASAVETIYESPPPVDGGSPDYGPTSPPAYLSGQHQGTTEREQTTPRYSPTSPQYSLASPQRGNLSPQYSPTSPRISTPDRDSQSLSPQHIQRSPNHSPTSHPTPPPPPGWTGPWPPPYPASLPIYCDSVVVPATPPNRITPRDPRRGSTSPLNSNFNRYRDPSERSNSESDGDSPLQRPQRQDERQDEFDADLDDVIRDAQEHPSPRRVHGQGSDASVPDPSVETPQSPTLSLTPPPLDHGPVIAPSWETPSSPMLSPHPGPDGSSPPTPRFSPAPPVEDNEAGGEEQVRDPRQRTPSGRRLAAEAAQRRASREIAQAIQDARAESAALIEQAIAAAVLDDPHHSGETEEEDVIEEEEHRDFDDNGDFICIANEERRPAAALWASQNESDNTDVVDTTEVAAHYPPPIEGGDVVHSEDIEDYHSEDGEVDAEEDDPEEGPFELGPDYIPFDDPDDWDAEDNTTETDSAETDAAEGDAADVEVEEVTSEVAEDNNPPLEGEYDDDFGGFEDSANEAGVIDVEEDDAVDVGFEVDPLEVADDFFPLPPASASISSASTSSASASAASTSSSSISSSSNSSASNSSASNSSASNSSASNSSGSWSSASASSTSQEGGYVPYRRRPNAPIGVHLPGMPVARRGRGRPPGSRNRPRTRPTYRHHGMTTRSMAVAGQHHGMTRRSMAAAADDTGRPAKRRRM